MVQAFAIGSAVLLMASTTSAFAQGETSQTGPGATASEIVVTASRGNLLGLAVDRHSKRDPGHFTGKRLTRLKEQGLRRGPLRCLFLSGLRS